GQGLRTDQQVDALCRGQGHSGRGLQGGGVSAGDAGEQEVKTDRVCYQGLTAILLLAVAGAPSLAQTPGRDAADFFEKELRPLLAEHCWKGHGEEEPNSGLQLTSRANHWQGGESGPAAVAGQPDDSLLIRAVRYQDALRMPPKEQLQDGDIDRLTRWVKMGLPWPEARPAPPAAGDKAKKYQITDEQRKFW